MQLIKVSENKRYLVTDDDKPFFWLGDTAWELFHKLNKDEVDFYMETRATQGFNVIQAVALAEFEGLTKPNAYGQFPLLKNEKGEYDPTMPAVSDREYDYWQHVDYTIEKARGYGIYIAFLPTWGDKFNLKGGTGPEIFTPENAYIYGKWLGERYHENNNIIWVLGGDRLLEEQVHSDIIDAMAKGIKEGEAQPHLMTFHPTGGKSSSEQVHDRQWLDMNMLQTGHSLPSHRKCCEMMAHDFNLKPTKPVLDGEPCYEDHPIDFKEFNGYYDEADVRNAAYWDLLSGSCGHTYGHHSIWGFCIEPSDYFLMEWKVAISRPGAEQMKHLKKLVKKYPILDCTPVADLVIKDNAPGINYVPARMNDRLMLAYSSNGVRFIVLAEKLKFTIKEALWYCPRTGSLQKADHIGSSEITFFPPSAGRGHDWILILE